jgi:hypothetical protein
LLCEVHDFTFYFINSFTKSNHIISCIIHIFET